MWTDKEDAVREAFLVLNDTRVMCDQFVSTGVFDKATRLLYYVGDDVRLVEAVFEDELMRTYPKVSVAKKVNKLLLIFVFLRILYSFMFCIFRKSQ